MVSKLFQSTLLLFLAFTFLPFISFANNSHLVTDNREEGKAGIYSFEEYNSPCEAVQLQLDGNVLTISNLDFAPIQIVSVKNEDTNILEEQCYGDCLDSTPITLSASKYRVLVVLYDETNHELCRIQKYYDLREGGPCKDIDIQLVGNELTISNLDAAPIQIVSVKNEDTNVLEEQCYGDCLDSTPLTLNANNYRVLVVLYDENNQELCRIQEYYDLSDGGPCADAGGDTDGDGVCDAEDCQPNNPNLPTTVGSSCNDGNPLTENDVIQADGCSCEGALIDQGSICEEVEFELNGNELTITNLYNGASQLPFVRITDLNNPGSIVFNCFYNPFAPFNNSCDEVVNVTLGTSQYRVEIRLNDENNQEICRVEKEYDLSNGGPCADAGGDTDGDGVCDAEDCQPNNPNLPTTVGSTCNDGDPLTENDVIQADGCSCEGTLIDQGSLCEEVVFELNGNELTITNLFNGESQLPFVRITDFNNPGAIFYNCFYNPFNPQNNFCDEEVNVALGASRYRVEVRLKDGNNQEICRIEKEYDLSNGFKKEEENSIETYRVISESSSGQSQEKYSIENVLAKAPNQSKETITSKESPNTKMELMTHSLGNGKLKVYPNPASNQLFIEVGNLVGQNGQLYIRNQYGQIMHQIALGKIQDEQVRLDVSQFGTGLYLVNTILEDGNTYTEKVMIVSK